MRAGLSSWVLGLACASACVTPAAVEVSTTPKAPNGATTASAAPTSNAMAATTSSKESSPVDPDLSAPVATIAASEGVGLVEGPEGGVGAWLALGPFKLPEKNGPASVAAWKPPARLANGATDPNGAPLDDHAFTPGYESPVATYVDGAVRETGKDGKPKDKVKTWLPQPAKWTLVSSYEGAIDLEKVWGSGGKPAVGYLASVLRLPVAQKLTMMLGADDGCEVMIDGKTIFSREGSRALRDDDDFVPLDLPAGDHLVVLKLHQHDAGWGAHVRVVDAQLRPPVGARWLISKAPASAGDDLAKAMSRVRIVRAPTESGWLLRAVVHYPEGAPLAPTLAAAASLVTPEGAMRLERKALGAVSIGPRTAGTLDATIAEIDLADEEKAQKDLIVRVDVAGRTIDAPFHPRAEVRTAVLRARATLDRWAKEGRPPTIPDDVEATLGYLSDRLATFVSSGDDDVRAELLDAKDLAALVDDADAGNDPLAHLDGALRLAHVAKADGKPQPLALYVPKGFDAATKKYPLYVGLHGMNGAPMSFVRIFFGGDDEGKTMGQMDRRFEATQSTKLAGFVLAPHAHGNAMYRQLGEEEVMGAIAWALQRYPQIDPDRVYMTGFSMGGIGAASIPLHHPDVFAAAMPLCGYHSYAIRRDIQGRPRRPWESFLIEDRSNTDWAWNGWRLPMYVVHGTKDLPEENSGVLIDKYKELGYSIKDEHPDKGHDVWGWAYDHWDQLNFFAGRRRSAHPSRVRFKTTRPRFGDDAWVHVDRLASWTEWAVVDASIAGTPKKPVVHVKTKNVAALRLDRDPALVDPEAEIAITIDSTKLVVAAGEAVVLHRDGDGWALGPPASDAIYKEGNIAGPIRDVWNEPLQIVYGASDPDQKIANLEVAKALARIRWGVDVDYPILRDDEVDLAAIPTKATIVVGNAKSNRLTRALEPKLPMQVNADGTIAFAGKTYSGHQLGAAFVVPHPNAPKQYLLVVEGVDAIGTLRALSLPELLPDFVIYDERLAPAHGQQLISFGAVRAAGFFDGKWAAPEAIDDPLFEKVTGPKSEKDSTAYLP